MRRARAGVHVGQLNYTPRFKCTVDCMWKSCVRKRTLASLPARAAAATRGARCSANFAPATRRGRTDGACPSRQVSDWLGRRVATTHRWLRWQTCFAAAIARFTEYPSLSLSLALLVFVDS